MPVFHGGRVKIMDTLARETIAAICGRSDYFEISDARKLAYDPLFTLMDLMIDPASASTDLSSMSTTSTSRDKFLSGPSQATIPPPRPRRSSEQTHRISPAIYQKYAAEIASRFADEKDAAASNDALDQVERPLTSSIDPAPTWNCNLAAARDLPWNHISQLPESHPARAPALAWRRMAHQQRPRRQCSHAGDSATNSRR